MLCELTLAIVQINADFNKATNPTQLYYLLIIVLLYVAAVQQEQQQQQQPQSLFNNNVFAMCKCNLHIPEM